MTVSDALRTHILELAISDKTSAFVISKDEDGLSIACNKIIALYPGLMPYLWGMRPRLRGYWAEPGVEFEIFERNRAEVLRYKRYTKHWTA